MDAYTVLVVDDDAGSVEFLQMILEDRGYQVLTAVGAAALCVAHERHPDVILLDLMMPGMDGIAVSRHLRADPTTADIPIIAMSAAKDLWAAAGHLTVNELLPKPFHFGDLCAAVARWRPRRVSGAVL